MTRQRREKKKERKRNNKNNNNNTILKLSFCQLCACHYLSAVKWTIGCYFVLVVWTSSDTTTWKHLSIYISMYSPIWWINHRRRRWWSQRSRYSSAVWWWPSLCQWSSLVRITTLVFTWIIKNFKNKIICFSNTLNNNKKITEFRYRMMLLQVGHINLK